MNKVNTKISDQYDFYYAGADESLYNRRFKLLKPRTTMRERQLLRLHLQQAVKFASNTSIRIIDFGCGDGRTIFPLYQLALTYTDYKFDIIAYDVSKVGLNGLVNILLRNDFKFVEGTYEAGLRFKKSNVSIIALWGNVHLSTSKLKRLFGKNFNLIISLYGAISHIPGSTSRLQIIEMFKNIALSEGIMLISLPSYASEKRALKQFNDFRLNNNLPESFCLATEEGDVYYKVIGSDNIYNFYHLYTLEEIGNQLKELGIKNPVIGIYSTFSIPKICENWLYRASDYLLCRVASLPFLRGAASKCFATNFFVSVRLGEL